MIIDPEALLKEQVYKLMVGAIVPRPIAWVSTVDMRGVHNVAPFSFFNGVSANPPILLFSTGLRDDGTPKDTLKNVLASASFVVNIVSEELAEKMNATSADVASDVDEFILAGLTAVPCERVVAARIGEAKLAMECKLAKVVEFGTPPDGGATIFGEIVRFHIADELFDDYHIDGGKLQAIGRMGRNSYTRTTDCFELKRAL